MIVGELWRGDGRNGAMLCDPSPVRTAMMGASTFSRSMFCVLGMVALLNVVNGYTFMNGQYVPCSSSAEQVARHSTGNIKGGVDTNHPVEREPCHLRSRDQARYRTYDGTCNAPDDGGAAFSHVKRFMPPAYQDGLKAPRDRSIRGNPMSSARVISLHVHRPKPIKTLFTLLVMQFGQFLDHDCSAVPVITERNSSIACCGNPTRASNSKDCYTIDVPPYDHKFYKCINFTRSEAFTFPNGTVPYPLGHLNSVSAWLDGSHVYGSDKIRAKELRAGNGTKALLLTKMYKGKERLPEGHDDDCINNKKTHFCALSGDERVNEQPGLTAFHLVFHLEHNRLVRKLTRALLYRFGRAYSDEAVEQYLQVAPNHVQERIYHVVRKVFGAVWQNLIYGEYLPIILGPDFMTKYKLWTGRRMRYDTNIQPNIAQEFLSCAFRFGHTLVNDFMVIDKKRTLKELFSTSEHNLEHYKKIIKGLVSKFSHSEKFDTHVAVALSDDLFRNRKNASSALDLAAINIQRGRDHGIHRHGELRRFFGLKPFTNWKQYGDVWKHMKAVYRDMEDVECFPGCTAEKSVKGGIVGETFANIIGQQFHDLKYGDRFFFETHDTYYGFTTDELRSLTRLSMTKILCENAHLPYIQHNPFLHPDPRTNPEYRCEDYPDIDMWHFTFYVF